MECVNHWELFFFPSVDSHNTTYSRREIKLGTKQFDIFLILLVGILNTCIYT